MRILMIPRQLLLLSTLTLLAIPVLAIQIFLVSGAPWWNPPYRAMGIWCLGAGVILVYLAAWMAHGRRWAWRVLVGLATGWVGISLVLAAVAMHFWQAFLGVFLFLFWFGLLARLRQELGRSYLDPGLAWYQGLPLQIRGLKCDLKFREKRADARDAESLRVARIDRDGACVFGYREVSGLKGRAKVNLRFQFQGKNIECPGTTIMVHEGAGAVGIGFDAAPLETRKGLGDLVEALKGRGLLALVVLIFSVGGACTKKDEERGDPKESLKRYIQQTFSVSGIEDRNKLEGFLTGPAQTRLNSWSSDEFKVEFVDSRRWDPKVGFKEVKRVSDTEVHVTYELTYLRDQQGSTSRITNKKLCEMVLVDTPPAWKIRECHNLKQVVEYQNEMTLP